LVYPFVISNYKNGRRSNRCEFRNSSLAFRHNVTENSKAPQSVDCRAFFFPTPITNVKKSTNW